MKAILVKSNLLSPKALLAGSVTALLSGMMAMSLASSATATEPGSIDQQIEECWKAVEFKAEEGGTGQKEGNNLVIEQSLIDLRSVANSAVKLLGMNLSEEQALLAQKCLGGSEELIEYFEAN